MNRVRSDRSDVFAALRIVIPGILVGAVAARIVAAPPSYADETDRRLRAAPGLIAADPEEKDYAVADFDGDGDDDVVVVRRHGINDNGGEARPDVLLMNEDGVLVDRTEALAAALAIPQRSRDVLARDLDGDGRADILVVHGPDAAPLFLRNRGLDAAGGFLGFEPVMAAFGEDTRLDAWTVAAGDVRGDGDGCPDVFIGTRAGDDRLFVNAGRVPIRADDAAGADDPGPWRGFTDASERLGDGADTPATRSSALVDIDGDGAVDLVQGITHPVGACRILWNDGGRFTAEPHTVTTEQTYNFAAADMDGDGDLDIVSVRNGMDVLVRQISAAAPGEASATPRVAFAEPEVVAGTKGYGSIPVIADLDGDGRPDLLVCDRDQEYPEDCSRRLRIFFGGPEGFGPEAWPDGAPWTHAGTSDVAVLDLDGDGLHDLLVGHCGGTTIWMQRTPASPDRP